MTLSNIDLMKLAKHYNINLNGIYMKDELNGLKPRIGNYIINLQSTNQGNGTHWTAIIFTKKRAYYFDSFGANNGCPMCPVALVSRLQVDDVVT